MNGFGSGELLCLDEPLSFWGGVDSTSGMIIDRSHPQMGECVTGRILVMEHGRGSSSAATVLAEMIRTGTAPAGMILGEEDAILATGAHVANALYGTTFAIAVGEFPVPCVGEWELGER